MKNESLKNCAMVFVWCFVIYYFSSLPSLKSNFPENLDFVFRKIAHITEYGILTLLFFNAAYKNIEVKKSIVYAIVFSILYALTDEFHQYFVFGRTASFFDVIIDSIGILLTALLIYATFVLHNNNDYQRKNDAKPT